MVPIPQSLAKNLVYQVYSTKNSDACLTAANRPKYSPYQAGIFQEWESSAIAIGGDVVHVHAFCS